MKIDIRLHDIDHSDELQQRIQQRVDKLDRLVDQVLEARADLKHATHGNAAATRAELTIKLPRRILRAESTADEPVKAIDQTFDKLVAQLRKIHDKRQNRHADASLSAPTAQGIEALPDSLASGDPVLTGDKEPASLARTKTFNMEPMDVDSAIEQMELIGHDFFFFKNEQDEKFSVLYRRRDGSYGLLSPE